MLLRPQSVRAFPAVLLYFVLFILLILLEIHPSISLCLSLSHKRAILADIHPEVWLTVF